MHGKSDFLEGVTTMAIDMVLWNIHSKIYSKLGSTIETDNAIAPLEWYIRTGRAPYEFERLLIGCTSRQQTTIANRLIKCGGHDYEEAINSVCQYIGFDRCSQ